MKKYIEAIGFILFILALYALVSEPALDSLIKG